MLIDAIRKPKKSHVIRELKKRESKAKAPSAFLRKAVRLINKEREKRKETGYNYSLYDYTGQEIFPGDLLTIIKNNYGSPSLHTAIAVSNKDSWQLKIFYEDKYTESGYRYGITSPRYRAIISGSMTDDEILALHKVKKDDNKS